MTRPSHILLGLVFLLAAGLGVASVQAQDSPCQVRYLSTEHVYVDAGSAAGLQVGSRVRVLENGQEVAVLEVVFVANHSASCKVLSQTREILVGDDAMFKPSGIDPAGARETRPPRERRTRAASLAEKPAKEKPAPQLRGSLAVQWDHAASDGSELETDYWRIPFRLKVSDLGEHLVLRSRGSLRNIQRRGYSGSTPAGEWRNRIQELALIREGSDLNWQYGVGRVGSRYTATAGPFDGLRFDRRIGPGMRLGAFGGFAPEWGTLGFTADDHLAGITLNLAHRSAGGNYLHLNLAGIGRYRGGEISREYLNLTTTWRNGGKLSLMQSADVDFNRGWRQDDGSSGLNLSSLALNGRWQVGRSLAVNLGFDDREPVRTWESRSLPDSLFQDAGRRGWRAGFRWKSPTGRSLSLAGSIRHDDRTDDDVRSWTGRFYWPRVTTAQLDLQASFRAFNGPYLNGWAPMASVGRSAGSGLRIRLEGGYYLYEESDGREDRTTSWARFSLARDLSSHWSVSADLRQDWGDDIVGRRWFLEWRRRF